MRELYLYKDGINSKLYPYFDYILITNDRLWDNVINVTNYTINKINGSRMVYQRYKTDIKFKNLIVKGYELVTERKKGVR